MWRKFEDFTLKAMDVFCVVGFWLCLLAFVLVLLAGILGYEFDK